MDAEIRGTLLAKEGPRWWRVSFWLGLSTSVRWLMFESAFQGTPGQSCSSLSPSPLFISSLIPGWPGTCYVASDDLELLTFLPSER